ncbi:hypothetical protein FD755_007507, partial [Muntiacus reevesi]
HCQRQPAFETKFEKINSLMGNKPMSSYLMVRLRLNCFPFLNYLSLKLVLVMLLNLLLQTGMRSAFGKPQGTVARVHTGQVIMSIPTKLQNKEHVIEALRRANFKFPWGFTKFNADEFENMVAEMRLIPDGCGVKYIPNHGPLDKWRALHS